MEIKYNNMVQEIPKWGYQFRVSADVTVDQNSPHLWTNVYHLTKGGSISEYGDRIPALFANRNGYFAISSSVNGNSNHWYIVNYEVGQKYNIIIQQYQNENGKVMYEIIIDGLLMYSIENQQPKDFDNVKVYVSDPWTYPFNGWIENFEVSNNPSNWTNVTVTPSQPPKCKVS